MKNCKKVVSSGFLYNMCTLCGGKNINRLVHYFTNFFFTTKYNYSALLCFDYKYFVFLRPTLIHIKACAFSVYASYHDLISIGFHTLQYSSNFERMYN